LLVNDGADALEWLHKGVGGFFDRKGVDAGGADHDIDGGKESDEDGELDEERENRAERFDVFAFVEVHGLEGFELAIALAVLFDLHELGLDLAHQAGLVQLSLEQRPHGDFDDDSKDDDGDAEIANKVVGDKKEVDDGADDKHVYKFEHGLYYSIVLPLSLNFSENGAGAGASSRAAATSSRLLSSRSAESP